jgi:hypothetical protein
MGLFSKSVHSLDTEWIPPNWIPNPKMDFNSKTGVFGGNLTGNLCTGNQRAAFQMRPFYDSNAHGVVNLPAFQIRPR